MNDIKKTITNLLTKRWILVLTFNRNSVFKRLHESNFIQTMLEETLIKNNRKPAFPTYG